MHLQQIDSNPGVRRKTVQRSRCIYRLSTDNTDLIQMKVLYGSESWELALADCERMLVFERQVLRTMFSPGKLLKKRHIVTKADGHRERTQ